MTRDLHILKTAGAFNSHLSLQQIRDVVRCSREGVFLCSLHTHTHHKHSDWKD